MSKIQFSERSGFERARAIELANLIELAYSEYETLNNNQTYSPPQTLMGRLAQQYERIENFWATEWWWLNLLSIPLVRQALQQDFNGFKNSKTLVINEPLFGFIARSKSKPNEVFVIFRGTREEAEWFNNFRPVPKFFLEETEGNKLGEVRNGFNGIYSKHNQGPKKTIQETIERRFSPTFELLKNGNQIFIAGHSLGAALATLASVHIQQLAKKFGVRPRIYLYTFGSPKVGGEQFGRHFDLSEAIKIDSYRIFNTEDIVPYLPLTTNQIVDEAILRGMQPPQIARLLLLMEKVTNSQFSKRYQHVGLPIPFTKKTGTITGNHNLTKTYREALEG